MYLTGLYARIAHILWCILPPLCTCHQLDLKLAATSKQEYTLHSFSTYSTALFKVTKLEENTHCFEEATAAEQSSTFLTVRGMDSSQVEYCRQATAEFRRKIETLVGNI